MRIKYVGHSYHQKTRSTDFFIELLRQLGTVDFVWDESWKAKELGADLSGADSYDLVVIFQTENAALQASKLGLKNVVFVPMYDGAKHLADSDWWSLRNIKILCFSSFLYEKVQRLGHKRSAYFQYYVDPSRVPEVRDFSAVRVFFWQRRREISLPEVLTLLEGTTVESVHLHCAPDPGQGGVVLPTEQEAADYRIRTSQWFASRDALHEAMARSNVFFASRPDEGIGLSFIEAMAMGMVVIAPSAPTMNEYIVDGLTGLLYKLLKPQRLGVGDLDRLRQIGQRAREAMFSGYERWREDESRLLEFCRSPTQLGDSSRYRLARTPKVLNVPGTGEEALESGARVGGRRAGERAVRSPLVTVATVVRDAKDELLLTLSSVVQQDVDDFEIVVIDGGSTDGTLEALGAISGVIDYWESGPDRGPYDGMNRAAAVARGEWIIFMNAGDYFCSNRSLRELLGTPSSEEDFVVGHHVYLSTGGIEEIHRVRDFEKTWAELRAGNLPNDWLTGVPGHQTTLVRASLLRRHPFNLDFKIAADHDFMYRMRASGSRFHVSDVIASVYRGGGLSWQHQTRCCQEWLMTCKAHSENARGVDSFFGPMLVNSLQVGKRAEDWLVAFRSYPGRVIGRVGRLVLRELGKAYGKMWRRGIFLDLRAARREGAWEVTGFSNLENWGRWTDGEVSTVETGMLLKGMVVLRIDCPKVFKPSLEEGAFVRIGETCVAFKQGWSGGVAVFRLKVPSPASTVEFVVSMPVSPLDLGLSSDCRKLGLGVRSLAIRQSRG